MTEEKRILEDVSDGDVYRFLTSYHIYQDKLSWSRVQGAAIVELAALPSALALKPQVGAGVLIIATAVVLAVWNLMLRDWEVRDWVDKMLSGIHGQFAIQMIPLPKYRWRRGRHILPALVLLVILLNGGLSICLMCGGQLK